MRYKINKNVLWRVVDGEIILVNAKNNEYSCLNPSGAEIWLMIDKGMDSKEIISKLAEIYDASVEMIGKETKKVINDLIKAKLILTDPV